MEPKAYGRVIIWEGASLWVLGLRPGEGRTRKTAPHSHHAIQITLSLRGGFTLESGDGQVHGGAAAVAPDSRHTFSAEGAVAHLFIEPEGLPGRELQHALFSGASGATIVEVPASRLADFPARLLAELESPRRTDQSLLVLGRALLAHLAPDSGRDLRPEVRVRRMSAWAAARLEAPVSLVDAAAHVGLSTGRARHLFVAETGLPFRTYLLWLRLNRAVELFSSGASLTDAAHGAGFSDSSHLSRTFRRMFGIAADSLRLQ